jgi:enamine deaminase RidA (YjgF/YER057c/UK114 family)
MDPEVHDHIPPDVARQTELVFQNMRSILSQAGATLDNLLIVRVFLKDMQYLDYVNPEWLKMFPDPRDRPARSIHIQGPELGTRHIQLEILAVLEG